MWEVLSRASTAHHHGLAGHVRPTFFPIKSWEGREPFTKTPRPSTTISQPSKLSFGCPVAVAVKIFLQAEAAVMVAVQFTELLVSLEKFVAADAAVPVFIQGPEFIL